MSLGIRPEHLLPSDIVTSSLRGKFRSSSNSATKPKPYPDPFHSSKPGVPPERRGVVEEGATFAIGLPPERCHLFLRMALHVVDCIRSRAFKHPTNTQSLSQVM